MNPVVIRLAAIAALTLTSALTQQAWAGTVVYELSGTLSAQSVGANTLVDLADLEQVNGGTPFTARLTLDTAAAGIVNNALTPQVANYAGAVTAIDLTLGGYGYHSSRPLYDTPSTTAPATWDESLLSVLNYASPTLPDRLAIETDDYADVSGFPGPTTRLFAAHAVPVDLLLNGIAYDTMVFRLTGVRLDVMGNGMFATTAIPSAAGWASNAAFAAVKIDLDLYFTSPSGPPTPMSVTIFQALDVGLVTTAVPEPASAGLLLAGVALLAGRRLRFRGA